MNLEAKLEATAPTESRLTRPDTTVLKDIAYPSDQAIQPNWIAQRYPEYAVDHGMEHEMSSVRAAEHNGHQIKITTTYKIEIDGQEVHLHALVGDNGQLFCHTTPYVEYTSAIDLVKTLLDKFPEAFSDAGNHGHHHSPGQPSQQPEHHPAEQPTDQPVEQPTDQHPDQSAEPQPNQPTHGHGNHDHDHHHHH